MLEDDDDSWSDLAGKFFWGVSDHVVGKMGIKPINLTNRSFLVKV